MKDNRSISTVPFPAHILALLAQIVPGMCAHKAWAVSKLMYQAVRNMIRHETRMIQQKLKHDMLRNPNWKARVKRDLGGEAALLRWDARLAAYREDIRPAPRHRPIALLRALHPSRLTEAERKRLAEHERGISVHRRFLAAHGHPDIQRDSSKLDRAKQFCLAKPPRRKTNNMWYEQRRRRTDALRRYAPRTYFKPIALYPHELRERAAPRHPERGWGQGHIGAEHSHAVAHDAPQARARGSP